MILPWMHNSITATIACNMDLTKYPMDRQVCTLQLESCEYPWAPTSSSTLHQVCRWPYIKSSHHHHHHFHHHQCSEYQTEDTMLCVAGQIHEALIIKRLCVCVCLCICVCGQGATTCRMWCSTGPEGMIQWRVLTLCGWLSTVWRATIHRCQRLCTRQVGDFKSQNSHYMWSYIKETPSLQSFSL